MLEPEDMAWLEYQVAMGQRLDLENLNEGERFAFRAVFNDGFMYGERHANAGGGDK